jgi:hypothetical protein
MNSSSIKRLAKKEGEAEVERDQVKAISIDEFIALGE